MAAKQPGIAIVWLRRDLRLADNPALVWACENSDQVLCVYIYAPDEEVPWSPGAASCWWLHHSLIALEADLKKTTSQLIIRAGSSLETLRSLIQTTGAKRVVWNRLYEPASLERDAQVAKALQNDGVEVQQSNSALLFEPWEVKSSTLKSSRAEPIKSNQGYKVFTPYWRRCLQMLSELPAPLKSPRVIRAPASMPTSITVASLELLPKINWYAGIAECWQPGELGAHAQLDKFVEQARDGYVAARDEMHRDGTSHLSPHLHFGELGPRQILAALQDGEARSNAGNDALIRQLGWREFAHHVLHHFPNTPTEPFDARFANYPWAPANEKSNANLAAWQRGRTGIPVIDAGMRELWHTGYMHNRVRMLVASFLTKNLQVHWLQGARWFWSTLVDADLANNTLGWQWTAGCGTDAAPFFRIFNPVLQSRRFDANGVYVRRWVPELSALSDQWIHEPWAAPEQELAAARIVLGKDYPLPIVDLKYTRELALQSYKSMRTL